jgi:hypothetical protein
MAEMQVVEEMGVHFFRGLSRPCQPETNRHLGVTEEELSIRDSQTKIDGEQDLGHLRRWRAQTIERGPQTTGKTFPAGLTAEPLNPVSASFAIAHQGVEGRSGVAVIITVLVGTGIPRRANRLGLAARTFPFTPREHAGLARVAQQRRRMWPPARWAIVRRAWLEGARGLALGRSARCRCRLARRRWRPTRTSAPNRPNHIRFS